MPLVRKPSIAVTPASADTAGVLAALSSVDADERWKAARAAATLPDATRELLAALHREADPRVQEAIFTSLARIGTAESIDGLLTILRSDDAHRRTGALDALRTVSGAAKELVSRLLNDPDVDVRILSCELARSLPSEAASEVLSALLAREQHVNVCAAAIDVLVEVGGPDAVPALIECEKRFRDAPFIAFAVKTAIARINGKSASDRA